MRQAAPRGKAAARDLPRATVRGIFVRMKKAARPKKSNKHPLGRRIGTHQRAAKGRKQAKRDSRNARG